MSKVLIDFASIMKTCQLAGLDVEGYDVVHEGKNMHINSAAYGYENAVNSIKSTLEFLQATPKDAVFVVERGSTLTKRKAISQFYKSKRATKPVEFYREYEKAAEQVLSVFKKLGSTVAYSKTPCEGDDILAFLSAKLSGSIVVSNDGDLAALKTNACDTLIHGMFNTSVKCEARHLTLYKALVGDTSDTITGCPGFGEKAWIEVAARYDLDGLDELNSAIASSQRSKVEDWAVENDCKHLRKIVDKWQEVVTSYRLAKMYPEWVDIAYEAGACVGAVDDERLKHWAAQSRLVTADKWDKFVPWAKEKIAQSDFVALDIETYTDPESDDWLAEIAKVTKGDKVDVIGSKLCGLSLTFGDNLQYTVYISVAHKDTDNVSSETLRDFVMAIDKKIVVHNSSFELPVLKNEWPDVDNGYQGYLPNMLDSQLEASYVDENESRGLKDLSKRLFDYDQTTYDEVTTIDGVQHKMNGLTGEHVKDYGCDDALLTAALHNYFELFMRVEESWDAYLQTEIGAAYLHADSFVHGVKCDVRKLTALQQDDEKAANEAWDVVNPYLIAKGWDGTVCPQYDVMDAAAIKEFVLLASGQEIKTMLRTPAKIIPLVQDAFLRKLLESADVAAINAHLRKVFKPAPLLNLDSSKQMQKLLYETMGFPVEVRRDPTEKMLLEGKTEGNPSTDADAVKFCARHASEEQKKILYALDVIGMVGTRQSLFYRTWPAFVHWKTGRVHASHRQCGTTTRRASESAPNRQQLSKALKVDGFEPRIREIIVPARRDSVIVSMDESSHELRLAAHYSRDPALLSAFIGDNLRDLHSLTGIAILKAQTGREIPYDLFEQARGDKLHPDFQLCKKARAQGKTTNFLDQYGGGFKKLAVKLLVPHDEAKLMLRAKKEAFAGLKAWTEEKQGLMKRDGYVQSLLGARRHLRQAIAVAANSEDPGAPLRQGISYYIQGSGAEHLKNVESRIWRLNLKKKFPGFQMLAAIHDELVFECPIDLLEQVLPLVHAEMVREHGGITVPLVSSISFGKNFGEQLEIGNEPSVDAIKKGVSQL